jgi:hypothetical protein
MSKGVLLFAFNNDSLNYLNQARHAAERISKFMDLPTSIVTDEKVNIEQYPHFDKIIKVKNAAINNTRKYNDGSLYSKSLNFRNFGREHSYRLSPYKETIVMDTDFVICNDKLNNCFLQQNDFLLYKNSSHVGHRKNIYEFEHISDTSIDFYWATVFFFRKTKLNETFFNLVSHIRENYIHYRNVYQFKNTMYRNDFAFSIAIHIMNGFQKGNFAAELPGKNFFSLDKDILTRITNDIVYMLVEKENSLGEYTPVKLSGSNIHIMNKFSLERVINGN